VRVDLVIGSLRVGGTETQVVRLAREMSARGHDVRVLVLGGSGPLAADLEECGVPFEVFGYEGLTFHDGRGRWRPWAVLGALGRVARLWRALRRHRPDVCHAFLFWCYVLALPGAALARVPVRVSGRRGLTRPYGPRSWTAWLERGSNRFATAIVANAHAVARDVVTHERVDPNRVHVIHNGVDVPASCADVARQPPVGIMVANLIAYKGHRDLLQALAQLEDPPVVRMIGAGPEHEELVAEAAALGIASVARFEGHRPDASACFLDVQFAVLASHEEGFPNAVLEAMAAGVPVVATRVGGVPEIVDDGATGILVPPHDPRRLADAIATLARDPALRQRLGDAGRERIRRFGWAECVAAHERLYEASNPRA